MSKKIELTLEQIEQIFAAGYQRGCDATESGSQDHPAAEATEWVKSKDAAQFLNISD